jgi:hypothetical protein
MNDAHYSGDNSREFWQRIKSVPRAYWCECYQLGCALQNLEEQVLRRLNYAESQRKTQKPRKRASQ